MGNDIFADIAARAQRGAAEEAEHRQACTADPCDRCERYQCKCGARTHWAAGRCDDCRRSRERERWQRDAIAQLPGQFASARLDSQWLVALVGQTVMAEALAALAAPRVVAVGPPGSGKTSLVAAMVAGSEFSGTPLWLSAHQMAKARAQNPLGEGEAPLIARALAAKLLIVDELGGEDQRYASAVAEVLYERHAEARATWVTSGVGPQQIADRYGGGIARRVFEDAAVFRLVGRAR